MIVIPDLGDDLHRMWVELIILGEAAPVPWTLIGAQMVALHGWARGATRIRPSRDADILVDVRGVTAGTAKLARALLELGYTFDGATPEGVGNRFLKAGVRIDVLAPDGLGERVDIRTVAGARTVRVPGGTQALRGSEPTAIRTRSSEGSVPLPNLLGAILVKRRAISVDDQPDAQRRDTAFLLSLVDDPDPLSATLSPSERRWLRRHPYFGDPTDACYRGLPDAEDAAIVYRRLAEL